jgi:hypothetical protein
MAPQNPEIRRLFAAQRRVWVDSGLPVRGSLMLTSCENPRLRPPCMFSSVGQAPDGRPVIEVHDVEPSSAKLRLRGTASVHEGNVLIQLEFHDATPGEWHASQASEGGPGRGDWEIELPVQDWPVRIRIGEEDARFGGLSGRSVLGLMVGPGGEVVAVTSV